jgi:hypothetical protein
LESNKGNINVILTILICGAVAAATFFSYQGMQRTALVVNQFKKTNLNIENRNLLVFAINLIDTKLNESPKITESDLTSYILGELTSRLQPGLAIKSLKIQVSPNSVIQNIATGPFKGISAENRIINVTLVTSVGRINSTLSVQLLSSSIPMSEFAVFSMSDYFDFLYSGARVHFSGRIHSNGAIYMGGTPNLYLIDSFITSAGPVIEPSHLYGSYWQMFMRLAPDLQNQVQYLANGQSGCTNCSGTGQDWVPYSLSRFRGQIQDRYHGVKVLKIRTIDTPQSQVDQNHFVIDPVFQGDAQFKREKIAFKADIRIVNGVWYLKNPNDENDWPGIPVWSDHPGHFTTWNEEGIEQTKAVGQEDIRAWLDSTGPSANRWPAGTTPHRYSYYEADPVTSLISDTEGGVVSYGSLYRDPATPHWSPGFYPTTKLCPTNFHCVGCAVPNQPDLFNIAPASTSLTCQSDSAPTVQLSIPVNTQLLSATRGGFRHGVLQQYAYGHSAKSKIWAMNIDVEALQNALKCNGHPGELGCYFGDNNFMKHPFNGVVYVINTWKGQQRNGYPQRAPFMQGDSETVYLPQEGAGGSGALYAGSNNDANQAAAHPSQNQILPFQLCSDDLAGKSFDVAVLPKFKIPLCANYKDSQVFSGRVNSVRVINGATLDKTVLPLGLTIGTYNMIYTLGDMNSGSVVTPAGDPSWVPMMVAGDYSTILSNNWRDDNSRWDVVTQTSPLYINRVATSTTLNLALSPGGMDLTENWNGVALNKQGPIIRLADSTSFTGDPSIGVIYYGSDTYHPPSVFEFGEDLNYRSTTNQPPGIPYVNIFTVNSWMNKETQYAE